ncbi:MAG: glycosyltransferase 87 family protein [Chitinophagaceae bacterium]
MHRIIYIIIIIAAFSSLGWCVYRDVQIEKQYPGDLRNRIVGARLQKDGIPPYFHKWKIGDDLRYYDPQNFDSLKVSNITATPFFHNLMYPIADFQQRDISITWLWITYFFFLAIAIAFFIKAKSPEQKAMTVIISATFLYSQGWIGHIAQGQSYIVIPVLCSAFYFSIKRTGLLFAILAGISAVSLVLVRPTAIVFLIPFLLLHKQFSVKYKLALLASSLFILAFAFGSAEKISFWKDYAGAMSEQLKSHQGLSPTIQHNDAAPKVDSYEGWNYQQIKQDIQTFPFYFRREHGNAFIFINHVVHIKTPVFALALVTGILMLILSVIYYKRGYQFRTTNNIDNLALFAFCLYMITDIFSPIYRAQYYVSQWLFSLCLAAATFKKSESIFFSFIIIGILLNSINISFLTMEPVLGEYIIFVSTVFLILKRQKEYSI